MATVEFYDRMRKIEIAQHKVTLMKQAAELLGYLESSTHSKGNDDVVLYQYHNDVRCLTEILTTITIDTSEIYDYMCYSFCFSALGTKSKNYHMNRIPKARIVALLEELFV